MKFARILPDTNNWFVTSIINEIRNFQLTSQPQLLETKPLQAPLSPTTTRLLFLNLETALLQASEIKNLFQSIVSQPRCHGHVGPDNSLLWGRLSCAP